MVEPGGRVEEIVLRVSSIKLPRTDSPARRVDTSLEALAAIEAIDWAAVLTGWLGTQETPMPALVFSDDSRTAELWVTCLPIDGDPYTQVHLHRTRRRGLGRARTDVLTAELRSRDALSTALTHLEAGDVDAVAETIRTAGTDVLG